MDNDIDTTDDKELYVQFYDFENHQTYVPIRVTDDNVAQALPKLVRSDNHTYLFWLENNEELVYIDVSDMLKGVITDENGSTEPVVFADGSFNPDYLLVPMSVDSLSSDDDENRSGINTYHVFTDANDDLYVVWQRTVTDFSEMADPDNHDLPAQEIFATAKIREEDKVTDENGETTTTQTASWSKPYQLTSTGKINDGVATAVDDEGNLILTHNQYEMTYKGHDFDYMQENTKIITRVNEDGEEQEFLEGQLYEISPISLMATKLEPVSSLDVAEFKFSDETPMPGDTITVRVMLENNGLTTVRRGEIELY